jgi:hypothetical protein
MAKREARPRRRTSDRGCAAEADAERARRAGDCLVKILVDAVQTIPIVMTGIGDPVGN